MSDYKITKQLVKKFQDAAPEVKIVNGNKKVAKVTVKYSNGFEYSIEVEKIINGMEDYAFKENKPKMFHPISANSGVVIDVPEQLYFIVDKLNDLVQTNQTEEKGIKQEFENHLQKFYSEMGWQ